MYHVRNVLPGIISSDTFEQVQKEISRRHGVKIVNGIAETDQAQYHNHFEPPVHYFYTRRKVYWSLEQKAR